MEKHHKEIGSEEQHLSLDLEEMNGITVIILLNLLKYQNYSTSLNAIQESVGIHRSSFYYAIEKLKKIGLIEVNMAILDDHRKKTALLTSKGYELLKDMHAELKHKM